VLLVVVAITLAIETKSLLLGESASREGQARIRAALDATPGMDRVIHMKTLHLGPEELLVVAKFAVPPDVTAEDIATTIDAAEQAIRAAEPIASEIYLEPDLYRAGYVAADRPEPPPPAGH